MLDERAIELYLYACRNPHWNLEGASADLGIRVADIEVAVRALEDRLLLVPRSDGGAIPIANAPDVALAELVDVDERHILELTTSVARRRKELMALLPSYRDALSIANSASSGVEVVENPETVLRLLIDTGRRVSNEVIIVDPGQGGSVDRHEDSNEKDRQLLAQGVARRTLYLDSRRDHAPTVRTVAALEPLGAQFRTLPALPFRMLIFDRSLVVISRKRDDTDRAGLVLRSRQIVELFVKIFETAWESGSPFRVQEEDQRRQLTAVQESIVNGLTMGLTDEVLAARLGMSLRTCRRHIAAIFELLGAESRFQAGALAMSRGWISPTVIRRLSPSAPS